ncbi:MAG TPA: AmmeMemoRadiSam system protein A [Candidatus Acidoferrum sp.]|jgi:AmmeMemoRadiSam system protein A|nr:AmmeMemoRadiSam system protein A [Terriglobales bacterium]HJX96580.1 AmmeMemoRadiSam system protein A [Candidatus Acidoferrum sp.]
MPFLSETDRRSLLALARRAIAEAVSLQKSTEEISPGGVFAEKRGVFVTLHRLGRLRGCIGVVDAFEPLGESIARCAANAALHDPRFSPVRADELPELEIELSLLSPLEPILPEKIEIGKHGLLISQGSKRGLLLPQVAVEHKFGRDQFLEETCRKAGLNANAWQEPETQILGFTCEVFSEGECAGEQSADG